MAYNNVENFSDDCSEYYAVLNIPRDASDEDVRKSYRNLAQVYHPDKHTHPELKKKAEEAFNRLQEAYEALSDPQRRQVYDVYGKEGLAAGLEVSTKLNSVEDLKKIWEEFKRKQESERAELLSHHRGAYVCRLDLSDPQASLAGHRPLFRAASVTNSIDMPVGDSDVFYLQGNAVLRATAGVGSLILGYRRVMTQHDTLDVNTVLGPRPSATVTSVRQLTPYTSASLTTSFTAGVGTGLQISTTRHLPYDMQATLGWVVGPTPASGISLNIMKRGTKYLVTAKLELGAVTTISAKLIYDVSPAVHLRALARVGSTGMDLELGAGRKLGNNTAGYVGSVVGLQGVVIKGRLTRGGQTFEVPVSLSPYYSDVRVLATAYLLPPLAYVAISRFVVRPLLRWQRARREQRLQQQHADATHESLQKAFTERTLIEPIARRKARSEAAKRPAAGLVVLDAVYGRVEEYLSEGGAQQQAMAATMAAVTAAATTDSASDLAAALASAMSTASPSAIGLTEAATPAPAGSASASGRGEISVPLPPPWLSVASALQYQVLNSKLTLYPGISKKNQMGFADPIPGSDSNRLLYVAYLYGDKIYEVTVDDADGLQLSGAGELTTDPDRVTGLLHLGAAIHGTIDLLQR